MAELKRVWLITVGGYAAAFLLILLTGMIPWLTIPPVVFAAIIIAGMLWLATQKLKIFLKREELLTAEEQETFFALIFWTAMFAEYFFAISFAIVVLSE